MQMLHWRSLVLQLSRDAFAARPLFRRAPIRRCLSHAVQVEDASIDKEDIVQLEETAPFYDALFDAQAAREQQKARAVPMAEERHGRTMNVFLGADRRVANTLSVPLPDEGYIPDRGSDVSYEHYTEAVFNRLALPDENVLAYDWEWMTARCASQLQAWTAEGGADSTIASYPGLAIPQVMPYISRRLTVERSPGMTAQELLSVEIEQFNRDATPSRSEVELRGLLTDGLLSFLRSLLGNKFVVDTYGSINAGAMLPFSDVNLRFRTRSLAYTVKPFSTAENIDGKMRLEAMKRILESMPEIHSVADTPSFLPEIEFVHARARIKYRLALQKEVGRQERYLNQLRQKYPDFNKLYRLVRSALHLRGLANEQSGGASSYTVRSMIAVWYNRGMLPAEPAEQLLSFLSFWSNINPVRFGVSAETGPFVMRRGFSKSARFQAAALRRGDKLRAARWDLSSRLTPFPWMLCLQNPSFHSNDLGKTLYAVKHIIRTIEYLYINLQKRMAAFDAGGHQDDNLLDDFVGAFGEQMSRAQARRRKEMEKTFGL